MTAPICFIDTETDGLYDARKPWEIAVIRRAPDGTETEWSAFVEIDLSVGELMGLKIGRFYDRHPLGQYIAGEVDSLLEADDEPGYDPTSCDYVTRQVAAYAVARMTHGAHVVGAVPDFDTRCLTPLLHEAGLIPSWHYHIMDAETLAVGYLAGQGEKIRPPWKSDDLMKLLGVEPPSEHDRHTALGDARWVQRAYDRVMSDPTP